jgi:hypothetical protein
VTDKWFRPKRFGYGATPTNWKGWALIGLHLFVVFIIAALLAAKVMPIWLGVIVIAALTVVLVAVTKAKTDGEWHWNWR